MNDAVQSGHLRSMPQIARNDDHEGEINIRDTCMVCGIPYSYVTSQITLRTRYNRELPKPTLQYFTGRRSSMTVMMKSSFVPILVILFAQPLSVEGEDIRGRGYNYTVFILILLY